MPGRFLEISIHAPVVSESLDFYRRLGLIESEPGDVWSHHYAVVGDGRVALGLHGYAFDSPALSWVMPGIAGFGRQLDAEGVELQFLKTGDEQFNELGFHDPDGQMLAFLEARTFSPSVDRPRPACGFFEEYRFPVRDLDVSVRFWEDRGFVATDRQDEPVPRVSLTSDGLALGLFVPSRKEPPSLVYSVHDLQQASQAITAARHAPVMTSDPHRELPAMELTAPEGTPILVVEAPA